MINLKELQEKENLLLKKLSMQNGVSTELVKKLLRAAEENNYSNKSLNERRTDYIDLINFHNRNQGEN